MWFQILAYFKFLLRSTNQHGVHSPFVFDLVTKCLYDKSKYDKYESIKQYRTSLLKDNSLIEVTDLGAGSRLMKNKSRSISSIIKRNSSTIKRTQLLFRIANYFECENILELGTSLGVGTFSLSVTHPNTEIITIEGCTNVAQKAKAHLEAFECENITLLNGEFSEILRSLSFLQENEKSTINNQQSFDLIFVDGNHQKEATYDYFLSLLPQTHNNSLMIFDDIYWSKGMSEAWSEIIEHPTVTVSIDTFYWGIIFFRKEQVKEHFTIRI